MGEATKHFYGVKGYNWAMSSHTVLIVEDNEELRHLYKEEFSHNNFEVLEAEDGDVAVTSAVTNAPDAIILDLMLPRQGGIRVLRVLRTLPETKHLPIVILTALPNPEYREQTIDKVQGYFLKTEIRPKDLVAKIREIIDERQ